MVFFVKFLYIFIDMKISSKITQELQKISSVQYKLTQNLQKINQPLPSIPTFGNIQSLVSNTLNDKLKNITVTKFSVQNLTDKAQETLLNQQNIPSSQNLVENAQKQLEKYNKDIEDIQNLLETIQDILIALNIIIELLSSILIIPGSVVTKISKLQKIITDITIIITIILNLLRLLELFRKNQSKITQNVQKTIEVAKKDNLSAEDINKYYNSLNLDQNLYENGLYYKGYKLEVYIEDKKFVNNYQRHYAVAIDGQGKIKYYSSLSFTTNFSQLIDEIKIIIDKNTI